MITDQEIYCANAGDSRTVLCERGQAIDLSKDHKPTYESEKKRVIKAGGEVELGRVNGILSLSRAMGDFEYKPLKPPKDAIKSWYLNNHIVTSFPDITRTDISEDSEFLVLACDGIWDCITSQKCIQNIRKGLNYNEPHTVNHNLMDSLCPKNF